MAYNEDLADRVREALADAPGGLEEKNMFRGVTFMVDGKMCVSVGAGRIMCRIDPAVHHEAVEKNGVSSVVMKGSEYRGYVNVDADVLTTKKELDYWVALALKFNPKAKASPKKKSKPAAAEK